MRERRSVNWQKDILCLSVSGFNAAWMSTITAVLCYTSAADLKNPPGAIYPGEPKKQRAGCTITLADEDYVALANGEVNPQQVW